MFRHRTAAEFGKTFEPPEFQVKDLDFKIQAVGKLMSSSKRKYVWSFQIRRPAQTETWSPVAVNFTDSKISNKRSLNVNARIVLDGDIIKQFGRPNPFQFDSDSTEGYPLAIEYKESRQGSYDLLIAGRSFAELQARSKKIKSGEVDIILSVKEDELETRGVGADGALAPRNFKDKILLEAQLAKEANSSHEKKSSNVNASKSHHSEESKQQAQNCSSDPGADASKFSFQFETEEAENAPQGGGAADDMRKTRSQKYSNDDTLQVMMSALNCKSDVSASTQETANQLASANLTQGRGSDLTLGSQYKTHVQACGASMLQPLGSPTTANSFMSNRWSHPQQQQVPLQLQTSPHQAHMMLSPTVGGGNPFSQGANPFAPQGQNQQMFMRGGASTNPFNPMGVSSPTARAQQQSAHDFGNNFSAQNIRDSMLGLARELEVMKQKQAAQQPQQAKAAEPKDPFSFFP